MCTTIQLEREVCVRTNEIGTCVIFIPSVPGFLSFSFHYITFVPEIILIVFIPFSTAFPRCREAFYMIWPHLSCLLQKWRRNFLKGKKHTILIENSVDIILELGFKNLFYKRVILSWCWGTRYNISWSTFQGSPFKFLFSMHFFFFILHMTI